MCSYDLPTACTQAKVLSTMPHAISHANIDACDIFYLFKWSSTVILHQSKQHEDHTLSNCRHAFHYVSLALCKCKCLWAKYTWYVHGACTASEVVPVKVT